jgi:hypothetical protein
MAKPRNTKNAEYCHHRATICPISVPNHSKKIKRPTNDLNAKFANKRKKISWLEYNAHMNEICHKHDNMADALIEMLQYTASVEVIKNVAPR